MFATVRILATSPHRGIGARIEVDGMRAHRQRQAEEPATKGVARRKTAAVDAVRRKALLPDHGPDFRHIPIQAGSTDRIQAKLLVGPVEDSYEQEADRVAEQVMRMPEPIRSEEPSPSPATSLVQRRVAGSRDGEGIGEVPPIVDEVLSAPGRPLDSATRAFMEPRFGYDFSRVRVHDDARAAKSARDVNAHAYAVGHQLVFGAGQYAPATAPGRRLLAHELTHSVQQGFGGYPLGQAIGESGRGLQRQAAAPPGSPEEVTMRVQSPGGPAYGLRNKLQKLLDDKVTSYIDYRDAIANATLAEKQFVLHRRELLASMRDALDLLSFPRCVEGLGRRAPTFDELRNDPVVSEAIEAAWLASNVGVNDLVTQAHEEGGWVFMNLIDGSLFIERAKAEGTDYIRVEPPPDVAYGNVLVAIFHTHPRMGRTAPPGRDDLREDARRGVPNLVAGTTGTKSDVYQVRLSGPAARKHLASDKKIPGRNGGLGP